MSLTQEVRTAYVDELNANILVSLSLIIVNGNI